MYNQIVMVRISPQVAAATSSVREVLQGERLVQIAVLDGDGFLMRRWME